MVNKKVAHAKNGTSTTYKLCVHFTHMQYLPNSHKLIPSFSRNQTNSDSCHEFTKIIEFAWNIYHKEVGITKREEIANSIMTINGHIVTKSMFPGRWNIDEKGYIYQPIGVI